MLLAPGTCVTCTPYLALRPSQEHGLLPACGFSSLVRYSVGLVQLAIRRVLVPLGGW